MLQQQTLQKPMEQQKVILFYLILNFFPLFFKMILDQSLYIQLKKKLEFNLNDQIKSALL